MDPALGGSRPLTLPYGSPTQKLSLDDLDWDDELDVPTKLMPRPPEMEDPPTEVDAEPPALTRSTNPPALPPSAPALTRRADGSRTSAWSKIATLLAALALATSVSSLVGSEARAGRTDVYAPAPVPAEAPQTDETAPVVVEAPPPAAAEPPRESSTTSPATKRTATRSRAPEPRATAASTTAPSSSPRAIDGDLGMLSEVEGEPGSVSLDSSPPAKVLFDGRPLGTTPIVASRIDAGTHTVTFIHPDLGKKTITVHVHAGEASSAGVRFP